MTVVPHSAATLRRRRAYSQMWAAVVIGWSVLRTIIVWAALGDYGFNPWIYLCIDLVCSAILAVTTPRMVLGFIDDKYKLAVKWAIVSLVAYIIPDIYIFLGTRTLPKTVVVILCTVIAGMLLLAVLGVRRKVHLGRVARQRLREAAVVQGHA
jgi:hypothetical protein